MGRSIDQSLNPAEECSFSVKYALDKNVNKQKRCRGGQFKKLIELKFNFPFKFWFYRPNISLLRVLILRSEMSKKVQKRGKFDHYTSAKIRSFR